MTKPLTIDTAAAWAGTITTIQDGDPASEATMDVVMDSVGDRLGYLKATADNSLLLASNAAQTLSGTGTLTIAKSLTVSGSTTLTSNLTLNAAASITSGWDLNVLSGASIFVQGKLRLDIEILANANVQMGQTYESRVPIVTSPRTYTTPVGSNGQKKRVARVDNTSNHAITISTGVITLGVIAANSQGWLDLVCIGNNDWFVSAWGGSVSSIYATVS